jgi:metallopeptidase MepB
LSHDEIVFLFHERGHGIHDLVSKTTYSRFHGTNTVIDFGELPSQMLENWCWTPSLLWSLSRHYSSLSPEYSKSWELQENGTSLPPEKIPEEMIERLTGAKHVNGALFHLFLLHFAILDMLVHEPESHEAIESLNISAIYNKLRKELLQMDGLETLGQGDDWGHGHANLGHAISEYDAGIYSYL